MHLKVCFFYDDSSPLEYKLYLGMDIGLGCLRPEDHLLESIFTDVSLSYAVLEKKTRNCLDSN